MRAKIVPTSRFAKDYRATSITGRWIWVILVWLTLALWAGSVIRTGASEREPNSAVPLTRAADQVVQTTSGNQTDPGPEAARPASGQIRWRVIKTAPGQYEYIPESTGENVPDQPEVRLGKWIEINLSNQRLSYFVGQTRIDSYPVSTGTPHSPTPTGRFKIMNKVGKAWSPQYSVWMPFWMGISPDIGLHELPLSPGGVRLGEPYLGQAVSHGCIRLGVGAAQTLFNWAEVGTDVYIRRGNEPPVPF